MSQENVEVVRKAFEAWNRGDRPGAEAYVDPDWEWRTAQKFPGVDAVYRGKEGFRRFWSSFREPWESIRIDLERLEDLGDGRVLALMTFYGKGRGSGVDVTTEYANVVTIRDGLWVYAVGYSDWHSAFEAAGLQE
jgi:ketosteroid isomerase-like protein